MRKSSRFRVIVIVYSTIYHTHAPNRRGVQAPNTRTKCTPTYTPFPPSGCVPRDVLAGKCASLCAEFKFRWEIFSRKDCNFNSNQHIKWCGPTGPVRRPPHRVYIYVTIHTPFEPTHLVEKKGNWLKGHDTSAASLTFPKIGPIGKCINTHDEIHTNTVALCF